MVARLKLMLRRSKPKSLVLWVVGIVAAILIFYFGSGIFNAMKNIFEFLGFKDTPQDEMNKKDEERRLKDLEKTITEPAIPPGQSSTMPYESWVTQAEIIYNALRHSKIDEDQQAAYAVLYRVKNTADALLLQKAFGFRQNTFFGIPWGDKMPLGVFVRSNIDVTNVNRHYSEKGIKFQL